MHSPPWDLTAGARSLAFLSTLTSVSSHIPNALSASKPASVLPLTRYPENREKEKCLAQARGIFSLRTPALPLHAFANKVLHFVFKCLPGDPGPSHLVESNACGGITPKKRKRNPGPTLGAILKMTHAASLSTADCDYRLPTTDYRLAIRYPPPAAILSETI